jgi:hypothetical protein
MVIISEEVVNAGERVQELDKGDDDERRTQPVMRSGRSRRILGGTHRAPQCAGMYQFFNDSRQHHGTPRVRHMTDWGTVLLLIPSALFPLAMVALVLWPMFAGVREISKAIRSVRKKPTRFILTNDGATIWSADSRRAMSQTVPVGDKRLRLTVLVVCAMEAAFIVFLTVFLFQHANPRGDGMEMVGVGFAFMLIFCRSPCRRSFLHDMDVGLCSLLDLLHSRQSRISLFGSKRLVSWGFRSLRQRIGT